MKCKYYLKTVPFSPSLRKFPSSISNTKPLQLNVFILPMGEKNRRWTVNNLVFKNLQNDTKYSADCGLNFAHDNSREGWDG